MNDYAGSIITLRQAADEAQANGEVRTRNTALNNAAVTEFLLGDLTAAKETYSMILEFDRKNSGPGAIALRLSNLSRVIALQDEVAAAEKMNAEECQLQESMKAAVGTAWCHTRLAELWTELGRKGEAQQLLTRLGQQPQTTR